MSVQDRYKTFLEDQREFFDALVTEDWDTYFSDSWDESRRYEIACLLRKVQPATILDIGCGCGFHDREMATYPFVRSVDAFDYSAKSIEKAEAVYGHSKVQRWVGDLVTDVPERRYDLVVSFQIFEHLSKPETYFRFCRAACAPGGAIAIFTPNRKRLSNRIRARRGLTPELLDPQHFKEYSAAEIIELGRSEGFGDGKYFGYGLSGYSTIDRLSNRWRLRLGRAFPAIASGLCVILAAPGVGFRAAA